MKNRKLILILAAAALASAVSCVRLEVTSPDARNIYLSPATQKATKGIIEGSVFPTDSSFVVSAIHTNGVYLDNLVASYDSQTGYWATASPRHWPLSGELDFYAYSPSAIASYSGATVILDENDGVTASAYTCDGITDFLYASYCVDDCGSHPAAVPLVFSHALSQIAIQVKQTADYTTEINNKSNIVSFTVDSLILKNHYISADFAQLPEAEWSPTLSSVTGECALGGGVSLRYGDSPVQTGRTLVIPQSLNGVVLHVVYTVTQTITDNTTSESTVLSVSTPADLELSNYLSAWECGKKYVYTLSIGLDPITVSATTVDWVASGGEIIVEEV